MQKNISASALPVNEEGRIYHLNLLPEELADTVITVGDPRRVSAVSKHFDSIECEISHREFTTHTGWIGSKRLSVISTGIGTPNIDIVINELDALKNINLTTREENLEHKALTIVRFGTTGSLCKDLSIGELVVTQMAVGLDGLLNYYDHKTSTSENLWLDAFNEHMGQLPIKPYITSADPKLVSQAKILGKASVTVTCPGFYGPQGRILRAPLSYGDIITKLTGFSHDNLPILNFEMETSAILGLGKMLGHRCISLAAVLANRRLGTFSGSIDKPIEDMIEKGLSWLVDIN